jgi:hypothetical protein
MKHQLTTLWLGCALAGVMAAGALHAQENSPVTREGFRAKKFQWNQSSDGSGTLSLRGSTTDRNLRRASVYFQHNGKADITIWGDRAYTFSGRWTPKDEDEANLDIDRYNGNRFNLKGRVDLRLKDGSLAVVSINGQQGNTALSMSFYGSQSTSPGGGVAPPANLNPLSATEDGKGSLTPPNGRRDVISRVRVNFERNGNATLTLYGANTYTLTGTWTGGKSLRYSFTMARFNGSRADLTGSVLLDGRSFSEVELKGFVGGVDRVELDFKARDNNGGGNGGNTGEANFNVTSAGRGDVQLGNTSERLNSANVNLKAGNDYTMRLYGRGNYSVEGRFVTVGQNARVTITRINGVAASGSGLLRLSKGWKGFDSFTLNGTVQNRKFTAKFERE